MKLIDAYNLLVEDGIADNHRYFSEVYKLYGFDDDRDLKDYLDFIVHEPVLWLQGFPAKLTTKLAFSKPKTAVIKLLKKQSVVAALGADYVAAVHTKIWNTFKQEADKIVAARNKEEEAEEEAEGQSHISMEVDTVETASVGSVETLDEPIPPLRSYKTVQIYPLSAKPMSKTQTQPASSTQVLASSSSVGLTTEDGEEDDRRVALLKSVLFKMSETLPDGLADAFRLLVSHV